MTCQTFNKANHTDVKTATLASSRGLWWRYVYEWAMRNNPELDRLASEFFREFSRSEYALRLQGSIPVMVMQKPIGLNLQKR